MRGQRKLELEGLSRQGCPEERRLHKWEQDSLWLSLLCYSCSPREENKYYSQQNILEEVAHAVLTLQRRFQVFFLAGRSGVRRGLRHLSALEQLG